MKWIFINYRLWQLCNLENEEAFFEANGESIRYEYQSFLRHPAEQRNTITSHDSFRRMAQKLWKNYLKERSLLVYSRKLAKWKLLSVFCRIDLPSAMKIDYEKGRRRKNGSGLENPKQREEKNHQPFPTVAIKQPVSIASSLCIPLVILGSFSIFK